MSFCFRDLPIPRWMTFGLEPEKSTLISLDESTLSGIVSLIDSVSATLNVPIVLLVFCSDSSVMSESD